MEHESLHCNAWGGMMSKETLSGVGMKGSGYEERNGIIQKHHLHLPHSKDSKKKFRLLGPLPRIPLLWIMCNICHLPMVAEGSLSFSQNSDYQERTVIIHKPFKHLPPSKDSTEPLDIYLESPSSD